jgi:hypothetical protein
MQRNQTITAAVAGAILLGGLAATFIVPALVSAADPSATPAASPSATSAPGNPAPPGHPGPGGPGMGGTTEAVSDTSVAAKAIGISEADLNAALQSGKSVADVAKAHNVDVQKVIDALVQDKKDEIAAALKAGTITQSQADQQVAGATQFVTNQVNGAGFGPGGPGGGPGGHGGPGGLDADDLTAAAKALGMTEADLTAALDSGKTAAAVAKEKGVAVQTVIDAIVAADKAEFAAAVKAGTMTQAQADQMTANLTAHVTDEVNGVAGGPGHGPMGGGPMGWPGAPGGTPNASPSASAGTSG